MATRPEITSLIGKRALEISEESKKPCLVNIQDETDVQNLALLELQEGVIPLVIRRKIPNSEDNEYEYWELDTEYINKDDGFINFEDYD